MRTPHYEGPDLCSWCEDESRRGRCENCGSWHIHDVGACGNPECCGDNYNYCAECDSLEIDYACAYD
jgi:hypothetical protein